MKEKIIQNIKKAWAPTIVVTIIFFVAYGFFGNENTMIAPFAALTYLRIKNVSKYKSCLLKNFTVYFLMAILAVFAVQDVVLCVLVNTVALFWLAYLLIDEFNPTNYFPAGMALIFFQIAPVSFSMNGIGKRLACIFVAMVIIGVFSEIQNTIHPQNHALDDIVRRGIELCQKLIGATDWNQKNIRKYHHQLCEINQKICKEIYDENRSSLAREVKINKYCSYVAIFQAVICLIEKNDEESNEQLKQLIESMDHIITNVPHQKRIHVRVNRLDIRSFRLRFALRQVCIVMPCLVFAYVTNLNNAYWLAISVFFMMIPLYERTPGRIAQRMQGTLAGLLICIVLFGIFTTMPSRIIIMTIFNFLIYCANSYATMVTCITCSALALNFSENQYLWMLVQRLLYTIVGGVIAWIANTMVFPIRARYQKKLIEEIFKEIQKDAHEALKMEKTKRVHLLNRLTITSYMLAARLKNLDEALPKEQRDEKINEKIQAHMLTLATCFLEKMM